MLLKNKTEHHQAFDLYSKSLVFSYTACPVIRSKLCFARFKKQTFKGKTVQTIILIMFSGFASNYDQISTKSNYECKTIFTRGKTKMAVSNLSQYFAMRFSRKGLGKRY
jgi:hypothetical protein